MKRSPIRNALDDFIFSTSDMLTQTKSSSLNIQNGSKKVTRASFALFIGMLAILLPACNEPPQITTHRVPKAYSGLDGIRESTPISTSTEASASLTVPDGWTAGATNSMVVNRFSKLFDGEKVEVTVVPLPSSNDWNSNVVRWTGQLGLQLSADQIQKRTTEVQVDGTKAQRIELADKKTTDDKAIFGVMAIKGDTAWFIKMMGGRDGVIASEEVFDNYVSSFRFP